MAKDRQPLDLSLLDEAPVSIPAGAEATGDRPMLDLSLLEEEAVEPTSGSDEVSADDQAKSAALSAERRAAQKQVAQEAVREEDEAGGAAALLAKKRAELGDVPGEYTDPGMDLLNGVANGVANAVNNTLKGAESVGDWVAEKTGLDKTLPKVREVPQIPVVPTKTIAGKMTESVTQFTVGMVGWGKFLKGAQILQGSGKLVVAGRGALQGALTDATVFDPMEERLSNLVEEHPTLSNPITAFLAAKEDDTAAEGRFKNAVEGVLLGGAVESLLAGIKGIRRVRTVKAEKGVEAAVEEAIKLSDEAEGAGKAADAAATTGGLPAAADTASAKTNVAGIKPPTPLLPEDSIKEYMKDRLMKGSEFDPGYSRDFNIAKQSTTDGAKQVINLMSDALAPEIDSLKGGVQTFEKIKSLAAIAGEDPNNLMARMSARAADAKRVASDVVATEEWMLSTARQISEEAKRLDSGVVTDPTFLNQMMDNMAGVVADLKAVKTGAARTTSAGRMVKGEGFTVEQIRALVASGGDLEQVAKIVQGPSAMTRALNVHNEYWINSLLSGPKTHLVNMTSNLLSTFARPTEKILGGQVREGLHEFMGIAKSIRDSVAMASKSFRLEESILDPANLKTEGARFAISSGNLGMKPNSFMGAATDWLGKAVRMPTRFLMAEDEFFKQLNYRANVYARSTREGVEKGLDGKQLADYIETRFASAFDGTGKGLDDTALREARVATFTEELRPGMVADLNAYANKHPGFRLIAPFIRTPTNIIKQLTYRTPVVNLLLKSYREELAAGGSRAAAARGKWATGGMLWGAGLMLASEGKLTGKGPENPDERAALMATGWRPYSVKADDGTYYDYSRLDPFGMALGLAADATEARGYMSDGDWDDLALVMGSAMMRTLSSKTYLRGMTEALDAFSQPDRKMKHWIQSRAGSYVPSGAKQIAGLIPGQEDDTMREVRSVLDAIKARTPGLSQTLPPKRNLLGEPIKYPAGLGPDSVSPFAYSPDLKDDVKAELARLAYGFKMPAEVVGNVRLTDFKNAKGQDAYDRLLELRSIERKGRYTLKERLAALIESESYKRLPDGNDEYSSKKLERVREVLGEYHLATLKRLRKEYPEVDAAIRTDAQNAKAVQRKGLDALKPLLSP